MGYLAEMWAQLATVEVLGTVETREVTGKDGKGRTIRTQPAYLVFMDEHGVQTRQRMRVESPRSGAYPAGSYFVGGASLEVGKYGDLGMRLFGLTLVPVPPAFQELVSQDRKRQAA
jgi:hypothetical protein